MELTKLELRCVRAILTQENLAVAAAQQPTNLLMRETCTEIEERLGLPAGAIGKTHRIDVDKGTVTGPPEPSKEPETTPRPELAAALNGEAG